MNYAEESRTDGRNFVGGTGYQPVTLSASRDALQPQEFWWAVQDSNL